MKDNYKTQEKIYDAEVLESSTFDENIIIKILIKAGRTIAKPALEVLEMALDPYKGWENNCKTCFRSF